MTLLVLSVVLSLSGIRTGPPGGRSPLAAGSLINGYWAVSATVDGNAGLFVVATTLKQSVVSGAFMDRISPSPSPTVHTLSVGRLELTGIQMPKVQMSGSLVDDQTGEEVVGVLGLDVVSRAQFGLDVLSRQWSFWPAGVLKPTEEKDWTASASSWPHATGHSAVERIALRSAHGGFAMDVAFGGHKSEALVDLGAGLPYVPSSLLADVSAISLGQISLSGGQILKLFAVPGVRVGGRSEWLVDSNDPAELFGGDASIPHLNVEGLATTRFLIDLGSRALYRSSPPPDGALSIALSNMSATGLTVSGSKILVGPARYKATGDSLAKLSGEEVTDISGIPANRIAEALRNHDAALISKLGKLLTTQFILDIDDGATKTPFPITRTGG